MDSPANVTVIMPAYRAVATIGRALISIARQSVPPRRVIVVDDGSDDDTAREVERHRESLGAIELTLLRQANKGPGAARNLALANAETELVAFLDSDDEWVPEKLARVLPAMVDPATVLVCHDMIVVDGERERRTNGVRHFQRDPDVYVALFKRGFISTSTVVARTRVLRDGGGFETSLPAGQDYELWLRIARDHGAGIVVVAEPLTRYYVMPGSITADVHRRRACALRIAARHAPELGGRTAGSFRVVAQRAAVISYEAWAGHWKRGDRLSAISALCRFPSALRAIILRPSSRAKCESIEQGGALKFSGNKSTDSTADALFRARRSSEAESAQSQDLNRGWWERLPMTYAEWSTEDRTPKTHADFEMIRRALFGNSPFLRESYDFAGQNGRRVLDLGCGSGVTACVFAENGATVAAADLTQAATEITQRAATAWGVPLRIARIDAESMGFADGIFDHVFSWGVLHHTRDTEAAFREVTRVLEPGGTGLIMVYHKTSAIYYLKGLAHLFLKGKILAGYNLETVQQFFTDGYYHRHFTRRTLHRALTDSGLAVQRILVTQMQKKILPGLPRWLDGQLKSRFGWLIVAEFEKPADAADSGAKSY